MLTVVHQGESIEEAVKEVARLHQQGIPPENLLVLTNQSYKKIIWNNYDLRTREGKIFSAHTLVENTRHIFEPAELRHFLKDRQQEEDYAAVIVPFHMRIESGYLLVLRYEESPV